MLLQKISIRKTQVVFNPANVVYSEVENHFKKQGINLVKSVYDRNSKEFVCDFGRDISCFPETVIVSSFNAVESTIKAVCDFVELEFNKIKIDGKNAYVINGLEFTPNDSLSYVCNHYNLSLCIEKKPRKSRAKTKNKA